MQQLAPLPLSESWDNTGLLLGCPDAAVSKLQTCLTLTPITVDEAVVTGADMVIAHHPLPFKSFKRITTETVPGRLLWKLASNGISVYSPHTAWDSARLGINALLAQMLRLEDCEPIVLSPQPEHSDLGAGRVGNLPEPTSLDSLLDELIHHIPNCRPRAVDSGKPVQRVAIACGSGASLLEDALGQDCDLFLTGEASFHSCLEAEAAGISLLMIGHFASERFAMEHLAEKLSSEFPSVEVWASQQERDPVRTMQ
jgi:dinuclear metal center YbgI/SA1388 family protein